MLVEIRRHTEPKPAFSDACEQVVSVHRVVELVGIEVERDAHSHLGHQPSFLGTNPSARGFRARKLVPPQRGSGWPRVLAARELRPAAPSSRSACNRATAADTVLTRLLKPAWAAALRGDPQHRKLGSAEP